MGSALVEQHGLTQQEAAFVKWAAEGMPPGEAYVKAGYSSDNHRAPYYARNLLRRSHIAAAFHIEISRLLNQDAAIARKVVVDLIADPAVPPKIRGDLAIKLLDRGGHVAPRAPQAETRAERSLHELSANELRTMVGRLEDEIARRAKPISSAAALIDAESVALSE